MKNKRKLDIIFWVIVIILMIIELLIGGSINLDIVDLLNITELKKFFSTTSIEIIILTLVELIFFILFTCLLLFFVVMIKYYYFVFPYIIIKIYAFANKKHKKEKLNKVDFDSNHYYRDIIYKYSPAILSYIDNFKIETKDLVATLLSLELKNKITIKEKIKIIDNNKENLLEHEKYVMEHIEKKSINKINVLVFGKKVLDDCQKFNLLEEKQGQQKIIIRKIIIHAIFYATIIILFVNVEKWPKIISSLEVMFAVILFILIIIYPFIIINYIKAYIKFDKINPYIKNKKGEEINYKLEGLKNYIKDFGTMESKKKEEIILWDEYLIYAVMFNINTEITTKIATKLKINI